MLAHFLQNLNRVVVMVYGISGIALEAAQVTGEAVSLPIEFREFAGRSNGPANTQLLSGFFELFPAHVYLSQPNSIARFQFAHSASGRNQALPEAGFGVRQVLHSQGKVTEFVNPIEPAGPKGRHGLHRALFYEAFLSGR